MLCRALGKLIIDVGLLVAEQCDRYLQQQNPAWPPGTLQSSIADSACAKVGAALRPGPCSGCAAVQAHVLWSSGTCLFPSTDAVLHHCITTGDAAISLAGCHL